MSELSSPIKIGHTNDCSTFFEIAPASNISHWLNKFSLVTQKIPAIESSSSLAMSDDHRVPFSMSLGVKYGFTVCNTVGSQFLMASATFLLVSPDQLINTFIATHLRSKKSKNSCNSNM
ncbi:hypothetical protein D3C85_1439940 [compost metagenome]